MVESFQEQSLPRAGAAGALSQLLCRRTPAPITVGGSAWFHSGSAHLGDRWAPCPAPRGTVGAPGLAHLPTLIPRQADLLPPLPSGGTDGLPPARFPEPAELQQPSSHVTPVHTLGWRRPLAAAFRGTEAKPGPGCREEHERSPSLPPRQCQDHSSRRRRWRRYPPPPRPARRGRGAVRAPFASALTWAGAGRAESQR